MNDLEGLGAIYGISGSFILAAVQIVSNRSKRIAILDHSGAASQEEAEATEDYSQLIGFILIGAAVALGLLSMEVQGSDWMVSYLGSVPVLILLIAATLTIRVRRNGLGLRARPSRSWGTNLLKLAVYWLLVPAILSLPILLRTQTDVAFFAIAIWTPVLVVLAFVIATFSVDIVLGEGKGRPLLTRAYYARTAKFFGIGLVVYVGVELVVFHSFGLFAQISTVAMSTALVIFGLFALYPKVKQQLIDAFV